MHTSGFLPSGLDQHQRAYRQHIKELNKQLEDCPPEERTEIERHIEAAQQALRDAEGERILW